MVDRVNNIFPSSMPLIPYHGLLTERVLFDFRRGLPVFLDYQSGYFLKPTEFFQENTLNHMIISGREDGSAIIHNPIDERLASHALDFLRLIKMSELKPSLTVYPCDNKKLTSVVTSLTLEHLSILENISYTIEKISKTKLPIQSTEDCYLLTYRVIPCFYEYYVLVINSPDITQSVNLRLHAECFTGDILGSLRCDCQPQLYKAIEEFSKQGESGVIIYVRQEGRNIGLLNKIRAYELQNKGHDTVDANLMLGFRFDERDYTVASLILKDMNISKVNILTNNPEKIQALEKNSIEISHRIAHYTETQKYNQDYINTKKNRIGHLPE